MKRKTVLVSRLLVALTVGVLMTPRGLAAEFFSSSMGVECATYADGDPTAACTMLKFVLDVVGTHNVDTKVFSVDIYNTLAGTWSFHDATHPNGDITVYDANGVITNFVSSLADNGGSIAVDILVSAGDPALEPITLYAAVYGPGTETDLFEGSRFQYTAQGTESPDGPALFDTFGEAIPGLVNPEPGTLVLLATGFIGVGVVGVRRGRKLRLEEEEAEEG